MKIAKFIFLFISLLLFYFFVHTYTANFISNISFVRNKTFLRKFFVVLFFVSIVSLVLRVYFNNPFVEYFYLLSLGWIGVVVIVWLLCVLGQIVLTLLGDKSKDVIVSCTIGISILLILFCIYEGNKVPRVKDITIKINDDKLQLEGSVRLVFIADTHFDFKYKNKIGLKIFQKISKLNPDFLIIGGDFLDPGFTMDEYILKLKEYKFKKIAVYGNHEYYYGLDKANLVFNHLGFVVLKNDSLFTDKINFIGLGDIRTENLSKQEVLDIISKNYKTGYLNIVISHQPLYFKEISEKFDVIMLSGHTHKGQIFPMHILTKLVYRYFYGVYRNKNSYLYVTSGAGVWGPPMRFLASSEIVRIDIIL